MIHSTAFDLPARPPYDFRATVESHGWPQLAPFQWDAAAGVLALPLLTPGGQVVRAALRGTAVGEAPAMVWLEVQHTEALTPADAEFLRASAARMARPDDDLSEFYQVCQGQAGFERVREKGQGRILRASSLFEDIVKTILTTNVNWGGTKRMVRRLVDAFGSPLPWDGAQRAFPSPQQILAGAAQLRAGELGLGYRAAYILELAERIAAGELTFAGWEGGALDADALYKEVRGIKGVGPYAAASLLMLLGRAERIPVDSWARKLIGERFFPGQQPSDAQLAGAFEAFGRWRGLAYWFYPWQE